MPTQTQAGYPPPCDVVVGVPHDEAACSLLRVVGECDRAAAQQFEADLIHAAMSTGAELVVADLADLDLYGSAALEAIISVRGRLRSDGRELVVRNPPLLVQRILDLLDLSDLVERPRAQTTPNPLGPPDLEWLRRPFTSRMHD